MARPFGAGHGERSAPASRRLLIDDPKSYRGCAARGARCPRRATDVNVVGLFPGKAVVTINRGAPRTLSVGQKTAEGVMLVSVDGKGAVLEIDGKKQTLEMGQHFESAASTGARNAASPWPPTRAATSSSTAQVNGSTVRFLVDTGATLVAISGRRGARAWASTTEGHARLLVVDRRAAWCRSTA